MEGIPINDLIKWAEKKRYIEESRSGIVPQAVEELIHIEDACLEDLDFIKNIESEFTEQADVILDSLHLSHLRVRAKKQARYDI
jgi:hypothetical protein